MRKNREEFSCVDFNYYIPMIILTIISLSACIGSVVALILIEASFPYLLIILVISLVCLILCIYQLFVTSNGKFVINKDFCEIKGKLRNKIYHIKRLTSEIHNITIKSYRRKIVVIALVDSYGTMGKYGSSEEGTYIKIQYKKKRLNEIKKYLPDCKILYEDIEPEELKFYF